LIKWLRYKETKGISEPSFNQKAQIEILNQFRKGAFLGDIH
jgi:hypothetical protein